MYTNSYYPDRCMGNAPVVMPANPCMNQGQMMQPGMSVYPGAINPVQPMPMPNYPSAVNPMQPVPYPGCMNQPMPLPVYPGCMNQSMPMPYPGGVNPMQPMPNQGCMNQPMPMPYPGGVNPMQPGWNQPMPLPSYPGSVNPMQPGWNQPMPLPSYPSGVNPMQPMPNQGCMNQPMPLPSYPDQGNQYYPVQPDEDYGVMPLSMPQTYSQPLTNTQTYNEPLTTTTNYKKTTYIEAVVPVQSDVPLMQPMVQKKKTTLTPAVQNSTMEDDYGMFLMDNQFEEVCNKKARTTSRDKNPIKCENLPLAQTYVQPQVYQNINEPEKTMAQGTYFADLYMPYTGGRLK